MAMAWKFGDKWEIVVVNVRDEPPQKWRKMRVGVEIFRVPYETALSVVDIVRVYKLDSDILSRMRKVMKREVMVVFYSKV
jgi:hypothetical protein